MPTARQILGVAAGADGRIYAMGGNLPNQPPLNIVEALTPSAISTTGISNVNVTSITPTSATINWSAPSAITNELDYGTTPGYGLRRIISGTTTPSITLLNLMPATLYHFRIIGTDVTGNRTSSRNYTFVTSFNPVSGGDSTFHYTITRQQDNSYRVDCSWTLSNGPFQATLTNVKLAGAIMGGASRPTSPAPLPFGLAAFFSPGQQLNFSVVFPSSAGTPRSNVHMQVSVQSEILGFNFGPSLGWWDYRVTLP